jgi:hypothetical protein
LKKFDKHDVLTKNQRNLMKKVVKFQEWLKKLNDNKKISVEILDIDDGLAVIKFC